LHTTTGAEWKWEPNFYREETRIEISRIYQEIEGVNYFVKDDWSELFRFFERYQVPFDEFWGDFKGVFEALD